MIKLPCKIGTPIYQVDETHSCGECEYRNDDDKWCENIPVCPKHIYKTNFTYSKIPYFEEDGYFLTREEAEQALAKLNENSNER